MVVELLNERVRVEIKVETLDLLEQLLSGHCHVGGGGSEDSRHVEGLEERECILGPMARTVVQQQYVGAPPVLGVSI